MYRLVFEEAVAKRCEPQPPTPLTPPRTSKRRRCSGPVHITPPHRTMYIPCTRPALFGAVRIVKLDEWAGLAMDHESTCEAYLRRHVLAPLGIKHDDRERYLSFDSMAPDLAAEATRVEAALQSSEWGGVDVCVLGLGVNGHLGLNEPADVLSVTSHVSSTSELERVSLQNAMTSSE